MVVLVLQQVVRSKKLEIGRGKSRPKFSMDDLRVAAFAVDVESLYQVRLNMSLPGLTRAAERCGIFRDPFTAAFGQTPGSKRSSQVE